MMLRILLFCALFVFKGICLWAAEDESPSRENLLKNYIRISGFVKSDYWYDSRTVVAAREDLFLLYPAAVNMDNLGQDLNADGSFNFSAITSRIALHIDAPDAFGMKTSGLIEADFSGVTNADINGFRLRHAFVRLQGDRFDVLMGQWWHPLFGEAVLPGVISLNTGAPFQPFIRNPQITLGYRQGNWYTRLSAISQRDNASDGPLGTSPEYLRRSLRPNLHLQTQYRAEGFTLGAALDYKWLRPRMSQPGTGDLFPMQRYTAETLGTWAVMAYGAIYSGEWEIRGRSIYGQNLSEHLMMGGYAERPGIALFSPVRYTPLNHLSNWVFVAYGKSPALGLFAGYVHNFGASHEVGGAYYGRGADIGWIYRLAPSFSISSGPVQLATELEYTVAGWGTPDNRGKVQNISPTANLRLLFTAFYFF